MHKTKRSSNRSLRTPSPEKHGVQGSRKHSPWTAPRARKKGKSSPDAKVLPEVHESAVEEVQVNSHSEFLCTVQGAQQTVSHWACGQEGKADRSFKLQHSITGISRTASRSLVLQPALAAQELASHHRATQQGDKHQANRRMRPISSHPSFGTASGCSETVSDRRSIHPVRNHQNEGTSRSAPALEVLRRHTDTWRLKENSRPAAPSSMPALGTSESASCSQSEALRTAPVHPLQDQMRHFEGMPLCNVPHSPDDSVQAAAGKGNAQTGPGSTSFFSHTDHGLLTIEHTPRGKGTLVERQDTPSPDVPAPGIRTDLHGRRPPKVPTSCKTIRRVLVSSPASSVEAPSVGTQPGGSKVRGALCFSDSAEADDAPMSIDRLLHDSSKRRCSFHSTFDPVEEMDMQDVEEVPAPGQGGFSGEAAEQTSMDSTAFGEDGSDDFVLARGHVTPNNLLPGWDDEDKGPGGPLKAPAVGAFRRSGELSTFEERLHENGDAVTVGQAWHSVRSGSLQPNDIDTLNALLKCHCKVGGDPGEAEEVVKVACMDGRLKPNSSTYHHMAALWTGHEQLSQLM